MKKIILALLFTIIVVETLPSQSQSCSEYCFIQYLGALRGIRISLQVCERQCEAQDEGWLSWWEQLECMIRGDCEEQDTNPAFLAYCKEVCQTRYDDESLVIFNQYFECEANCI